MRKNRKLQLGKLKVTDLDNTAKKNISGGDYPTALGCPTFPENQCDDTTIVVSTAAPNACKEL